MNPYEAGDAPMATDDELIPGPLDIDTSNYEEVTRSNYAEPLSLNGSINLH